MMATAITLLFGITIGLFAGAAYQIWRAWRLQKQINNTRKDLH